MSTAVGNIFVGLQVDTRGARNFTSAANVISRDSDRMRRALGGTTHSVSALRASMSQGWRSRIFSDMIRQASQTNNEVAKLRATMMGLAAVTGTSLTGAFAGTFLLQTADQANRLNNQLRTVAESEENLVGIRERLYAVSQLTRSDMAATVTLYARLSRAAQEFGASQQEIVRVTETIQKAFAIGGASQAEASGAAIQLSQGIASDRFSGEEYRSVSENAPVLLQQMARHLGVTIGKLREMAHAGELTGKVVTEAILGASAAIDEDFNKTIVTVGQGMTRLGNAFLMYIGNVDSSLGVTQRLAAALGNLAENMDDLAPWISGAAFAGVSVLGGRLAGGAAGRGLGARANAVEAAKSAREQSAAALLAAQANEKLAQSTRDATQADVASTTAKIRGAEADAIALKNSLALAQAQRAKAVATVELNRGIMEATGRTGLYNAALAAQNETTKTILVTQRALRETEKSLAANKALLAGQTAVATEAALAHNAALSATAFHANAASRSASAAVIMLRRVGSGLLNMLGGPMGIAFTAAIAGIGMLAARAAEGQERTRKLTDELHKLGLISDKTAGHVEGVAASIESLTADEVRNKIGQIATEIERLRKLQNPFEQLFGYDEQALGNIRQEIRSRSGISDLQDGGSSAFLLRLMREVEDGTKSSADAIAQLDRRASLGNTTAQWDSWASRLRTTFELLDGHIKHVDILEKKLQNLGAAGVETGWVRGLIAQQEALQAVQDGTDAIRQVVEERLRLIQLSEEEKRIEEVMNSIRKAGLDIAKDGSVIQEAVLRIMAKELIAAEKVAQAQSDYNEQISKLKGEIDDTAKSFTDLRTAADLKVLLDEFGKGNMSIKTMQDRLEDIGRQSLDGPMSDLITKIFNAVAGLSQLLGIFNSFHVGGTGHLPRPVSRDAVDQSAAGQATAARMMIATALSESGRNPEEAFKAAYIENMGKQFKSAGLSGAELNAILEEGAAAAWQQKLSMDAATSSASASADAAKKYTEGMAELNRELAAAPLDPFLKEVLSAAEGMGIATDELDAFIAAVTSGGIDAAPEKFRRIAESLQELKIADAMFSLSEERALIGLSDADVRIYEILRDTGLEYNSVQGRLIADNVRLNERMKESAQLAEQMRSTIASGLADIFTGLIDGSNSAGEAVANLLKQLGQLLINNAFRMLMNPGGFGGGGGGGLLGGAIIPGILHDGGLGGVDGYSHARAVSPAVFAGAPRFHKGLNNREFAAILEDGERVLSRVQTERTDNLLKGIAGIDLSSTSERGRGDLHLQINGSGLSEQQLARAIAEGIREYDAALAPKVEAKFRTMQNDPRAADGGW